MGSMLWRPAQVLQRSSRTSLITGPLGFRQPRQGPAHSHQVESRGHHATTIGQLETVPATRVDLARSPAQLGRRRQRDGDPRWHSLGRPHPVRKLAHQAPDQLPTAAALRGLAELAGDRTTETDRPRHVMLPGRDFNGPTPSRPARGPTIIGTECRGSVQESKNRNVNPRRFPSPRRWASTRTSTRSTGPRHLTGRRHRPCTGTHRPYHPHRPTQQTARDPDNRPAQGPSPSGPTRPSRPRRTGRPPPLVSMATARGSRRRSPARPRSQAARQEPAIWPQTRASMPEAGRNQPSRPGRCPSGPKSGRFHPKIRPREQRLKRSLENSTTHTKMRRPRNLPQRRD
jgi:hypothetical protein